MPPIVFNGEAAAIRDSVLPPEVRRYAPAWSAPLLLPRELAEALDGDGPEEYECGCGSAH